MSLRGGELEQTSHICRLEHPGWLPPHRHSCDANPLATTAGGVFSLMLKTGNVKKTSVFSNLDGKRGAKSRFDVGAGKRTLLGTRQGGRNRASVRPMYPAET